MKQYTREGNEQKERDLKTSCLVCSFLILYLRQERVVSSCVAT